MSALLLKQAIEAEDLAAVRELMTADPALHRAEMGYGGNGPLTWVAECRVPWGPPSRDRLEMARWMIENGSDVHQGGDGPLMRAALNPLRVPMMELLVQHGADVNAHWAGDFPILFAPCESVNPVSLRWLLEHGADPNCFARNCTALDYLIGTYGRSEDLAECVDLLRAAGGRSRYELPGVMETIADRGDALRALLSKDASLVHAHYPELDCGSTGARALLLEGGTLLHVAAEFASMECAKLLLDQGADVNARGLHGQTAIFHAATQYDDHGLAMTELLIERGANLSLRVKLPGAYDRPGEFVECTPLEYARMFPGDEAPGSNEATVAVLALPIR